MSAQQTEAFQKAMDKNKEAWNKSCEEYTKFCKAYYVNLVLTNRFHELSQQRKALVEQIKNKGKITQSSFGAGQDGQNIFSQGGSGKPGRGGSRHGNNSRGPPSLFGQPQGNRREHVMREKPSKALREAQRQQAYGNDPSDPPGMSLDDKRKRHRRTATEIQRHYQCPVEGCHKSYGSEGSMNQHMKLKH